MLRQAENRVNNNKIDRLERINRNLKYLYDDCCKCLVESIEKQKVKDKLEDYTERKRYYDGNNIFLDEEYYRIQGRIEILKELLEDK